MSSNDSPRNSPSYEGLRQILEISRRQFLIMAGYFTGHLALSAPTSNGAAVPSQTSSRANTVPVNLKINGVRQKLFLDPRVTLLDALREDLALTGTKKGCDHGQCGACTILVNGRRINSCLALAVSYDGDEITTIEGISTGDTLHPVQSAFIEHDGFQCGYCTPGQICSAVALMSEAQNGAACAITKDLSKTGAVELTADEIRERMSGNICRCGAYPGIVQAIQSAYDKT